MKDRDHPNLQRLIARMRNRLWLESALSLLGWGLWGAAGLLVAAAMVHVLVVAVAWRYGLGLAVVPVLMALFAGALFHRPSAARAALASDRRFKSRELFTSALEQSFVAADLRLGASHYLLTQAEAQAAALVKQGWAWKWHLSARRMLPLALAFSGLFLLFTPGSMTKPWRDEPQKVAFDAPLPHPNADAETPPALPLRREIEKFKAAVERSEEPGSLATATDPNPPSPTSATLMTGPRSTGAEPGDRVPGDRPAVGYDGAKAPDTAAEEEMIEGLASLATARQGAAGGDSAGLGIDQDPEPDKAGEVLDLRLRPVDIDRRPGESAGSRARALASSDPALIPLSREDKGPATPGVSVEVSYEAWFPANLRAYAQAYLSRLRQGQ